MVAKVRGRFTKWTAHIEIDEDDPDASRVDVQIDAASLDTQEQPRDEHLKSDDFLAVRKHPHIVFAGRKVERKGRDRYALTGDLTIVGISRSVTLDVVYAGKTRDPWGDERAGFSARATVNRKDWGLNWNLALEAGGVLVGEKVEVRVELELFHPKPG
jgi:polyisoprenoid-binding protein YceI